MISGGWIDAFAAREGRKSAWREGARTDAKGPDVNWNGSYQVLLIPICQDQ